MVPPRCPPTMLCRGHIDQPIEVGALNHMVCQPVRTSLTMMQSGDVLVHSMSMRPDL